MKKVFTYSRELPLLVLLTVLANAAIAQIRIGPTSGTVDGSATLEIKSGPFGSGSPYRGLLLPTVSTTLRSQIQSPATGLVIFNTTTNQIEANTGTPASPIWTASGTGSSGGNSWNITGNTGTSSGNFLGTIDNVPFYFRVNNQNSGRIDQFQNNVALGYQAYNINSTATGNAAIGAYALQNNTSGNYNTAMGLQALQSNTTGIDNTAIGTTALLANTSGQNNTATGYRALTSNTTGGGNTALGAVALQTNTTGQNNTALGTVGLSANNSGSNNTAVGAGALQSNTTGNFNAAIGTNSQALNTGGNSNVSVGTDALYNNASGNDNTAFGGSALISTTSGSSNMSIGNLSLQFNTTGNSNSAAGTLALQNNTTGSLNSALGYNAGPGSGNLTNSTAIGANSTVNGSNEIVLGNNAISVLRSNVQTISTLSDKRIKEDIQANVPGLNFITKLSPVTYHVNKLKEAKLVGYPLSSVQEDKTLHSGFLAQDVELAAKAVGYNFEGVRREEGGKYYTVGYTLFVMPLVQAVKELNNEVESLKAKIREGETAYNQLAAQVKQMQDILGIQKAETNAKVGKK